MSDGIYTISKNTDMVRAVVVTRFHSLEGHIHFPRVGKEGRRFSNMLNSNKKFIAMTDVKITNRMNDAAEPKECPFIQVNTEAIEYIQPYTEDDMDVG